MISSAAALRFCKEIQMSKFNRIHQKYTVLLTPLLALFGHGFIRGQLDTYPLNALHDIFEWSNMPSVASCFSIRYSCGVSVILPSCLCLMVHAVTPLVRIVRMPTCDTSTVSVWWLCHASSDSLGRLNNCPMPHKLGVVWFCMKCQR